MIKRIDGEGGVFVKAQLVFSFSRNSYEKHIGRKFEPSLEALEFISTLLSEVEKDFNIKPDPDAIEINVSDKNDILVRYTIGQSAEDVRQVDFLSMSSREEEFDEVKKERERMEKEGYIRFDLRSL